MTTSLTLLAAFALGAPALKDKEPLGKGPGYLGIRFTKEGDGLAVTEVREDSPALKAGLKVDDIILKIDSIDLKDSETTELVKIVGGMRPGTVVSLQIRRGTDSMTLKVKLAPRPEDFDTSQRLPLPGIPIPDE